MSMFGLSGVSTPAGGFGRGLGQGMAMGTNLVNILIEKDKRKKAEAKELEMKKNLQYDKAYGLIGTGSEPLMEIGFGQLQKMINLHPEDWGTSPTSPGRDKERKPPNVMAMYAKMRDGDEESQKAVDTFVKGSRDLLKKYADKGITEEQLHTQMQGLNRNFLDAGATLNKRQQTVVDYEKGLYADKAASAKANREDKEKLLQAAQIEKLKQTRINERLVAENKVGTPTGPVGPFGTSASRSTHLTGIGDVTGKQEVSPKAQSPLGKIYADMALQKDPVKKAGLQKAADNIIATADPKSPTYASIEGTVFDKWVKGESLSDNEQKMVDQKITETKPDDPTYTKIEGGIVSKWIDGKTLSPQEQEILDKRLKGSSKKPEELKADAKARLDAKVEWFKKNLNREPSDDEKRAFVLNDTWGFLAGTPNAPEKQDELPNAPEKQDYKIGDIEKKDGVNYKYVGNGRWQKQ